MQHKTAPKSSAAAARQSSFRHNLVIELWTKIIPCARFPDGYLAKYTRSFETGIGTWLRFENPIQNIDFAYKKKNHIHQKKKNT